MLTNAVGSSCTLILHELDQEAVPLFEREPEGLGPADVAAFTFDSGSVESFRQAVDQLQRVAQASGDALPCLLVAFEDQPMHQAGPGCMTAKTGLETQNKCMLCNMLSFPKPRSWLQ